MKRLFYIAAAAMAVLSACTKDGIEGNETKHPVFKAAIEGPATKTTLGQGNKVNWENGDEVYVRFQEENYKQVGSTPFGPIYSWIPSGPQVYSVFRATPDPLDPTSATLSFSSYLPGPYPEYLEKNTYNFRVVYPASLADSEDPAVFVFPATQTYSSDNISFAPMFYSGRDKTFAMKNAASILAVTVPASQMASVKSITVSSDEYINGYCEFTEDESGDPVMTIGSVDAEENKNITLVCDASGSNTDIPAEGSKTFYICIPVNHYGYLQIDVTDGTTTKSMRTTKADGIQVERNKIYPINFAANVAPAPTTGTAKATIDGNEVDVNWVQLWAGGPKFAEYNVGASSSTDTGIKLTHTDAISYANSWGANWCIPSKDDLDELQKAANYVGSTKLTCETVKVNDTFGFKFTGIGDYAENSVFFPGESRYGKLNDMVGIYWSNTSNDDDDMIRYWYVYLEYMYGNWTSVGDWGMDQYTYFVRPVLNN